MITSIKQYLGCAIAAMAYLSYVLGFLTWPEGRPTAIVRRPITQTQLIILKLVEGSDTDEVTKRTI
jgi:hypothetical protein